MKKKYYVYVYLDPRKEGRFRYGDYDFDYEPFYVGKGCGNRYLKHLTENEKDTANTFKFRVIEKIKSTNRLPIIIKVENELNEGEAYKIEAQLIRVIGRRCDNSGSLTNIVKDGKPPSNYKQLDKLVIDEIITLYKEGFYLKHIANKLSLNENKIKRVLLENGLNVVRKAPTNKIILDGNTIKKLIIDYESGLSLRVLSDRYGLSFEVVRKTLKKNGVILRGYNYKKSDEHIKKIIENREYKVGQDNPMYKILSKAQIELMKKLRFTDKKSIKYIIDYMNISQKKYYEYINL
jgi:DNA-binding transcriptional ArsR family regulator